MFDTVESFEKRVEIRLVSLLGGGKSCFVHSVVDQVVDPAVCLVDGRLQVLWVQSATWPIHLKHMFSRRWSKAVVSMRTISELSLLTTVWFFLSQSMGAVNGPVKEGSAFL